MTLDPKALTKLVQAIAMLAAAPAAAEDIAYCGASEGHSYYPASPMTGSNARF